MSPELLAVLGVVTAAVISGVALWATHRAGGRAAMRQADADAGAQRASEWVALFEQTRQSTDDARRAAEEARYEAAQCRQRVEVLEGRAVTDREQIARLGQRVSDGERRYRTAIKHIRELRVYLAQNLPGHRLPAVPLDLQVDIDAGD